MAFDLENMTVDYKTMFRMVPSDRLQVAQTGVISDLISSLTPGQLANLFPRYYRDRLPDVGSSTSLGGALSGGSTYRPNQPTTYGPAPSPVLKKQLTPEERAVQELFQKANVGGIELAGDAREKAAALTERMVSDLGISQNKAAAIVGNFMHESGDFQHMQEISPTSGRGGYGWAQWTGPRRKNFEEFVSARGLDINSDDANYQFFLHEIQNDPYERQQFERWRNTEYGDLAAETVAFENSYERAGVKHHGSRIQRAETALQMYQQRVAEIESGVNNVGDLTAVQPQFDPSMIPMLDERLQKWYQNANEIQKKNFEEALGKLGTDQFNETMQRQPLNNATLQAVSAVGSSSEYQLTDKLGSITPNLRRYDPNVDDPGASAPGEFNYSLSQEGIQRFNLADETGRITPSSVEKNLVEIETNSGVKVKVHRDVAENTRAFLNDLEARGYPIRSADTGGYSFRGKNGGAGNGLSTHSTGTTFDINAGTNGGTMAGHNPMIDMPPDIEKLANYYGFSWGAKFGDPMHFETMSPEVHSQKLKELEDNGYVRRRDDQIRAEAEAIAQSDPVTAAQNNMAPSEPPTEQLSPAEIPPTPSTAEVPPAEVPPVPVPELSTGGTVPMTPGENVVGINTTTGKTEFMSNDRELYTKDDQGNLRVDPSTIRQDEPPPAQAAQAETTQRQESVQPMQSRQQQPVVTDSSDPYFTSTMSSGSMSSSPSQLRALNRAKLYNENSSSLVNGHFS